MVGWNVGGCWRDTSNCLGVTWRRRRRRAIRGWHVASFAHFPYGSSMSLSEKIEIEKKRTNDQLPHCDERIRTNGLSTAFVAFHVLNLVKPRSNLSFSSRRRRRRKHNRLLLGTATLTSRSIKRAQYRSSPNWKSAYF